MLHHTTAIALLIPMAFASVLGPTGYADAFFAHDFTQGYEGWSPYDNGGAGADVTALPGQYVQIDTGVSIYDPIAGLTTATPIVTPSDQELWRFSWQFESVSANADAVHMTLQSAPGQFRTAAAQPDEFMSLNFTLSPQADNATIELWNGQNAWAQSPVAVGNPQYTGPIGVDLLVSPVGYAMYSDELGFLRSGLWPNGRDLAYLKPQFTHAGVFVEGDNFASSQSARVVSVDGQSSAISDTALSDFWHGWFTTTDNWQDVANHSGNVAMAYTIGSAPDRWSPAVWQARLDEAEQEGMSLIIHMDAASIRVGAFTSMNALIDAVDSHPATAGWYLSDEPEGYNPNGDPLAPGIDQQILETAYNEFKQRATKPIVTAMGFFMRRAPRGTDADPDVQEDDNPLWRYSNSYDVAIMGSYPADTGEAEFEGFNRWTQELNNAVMATQVLGKDLIFNGQAYGAQDETNDSRWPTKRLPTAAEAVFQVRYAAMAEVDGVVHWSLHRIESSKAQPDEPYPDDGARWLERVYGAEDTNFGYLRYEINLWEQVITQGAIRGSTWTNASDEVLLKLYGDPDGETAYLLAINASDEDAGTVRLAFDTTVLGGGFDSITGKYFDALHPTNGALQLNGYYAFDTVLGPWQTRLWEISGVTIPSPGTMGTFFVAVVPVMFLSTSRKETLGKYGGIP